MPYSPPSMTSLRITTISYTTECSGSSVSFADPDSKIAKEFERDPDLFVAKHLGLPDANSYRVWTALEGAALCSARNKNGKLCGCSVGRQLGASEWLIRHRQEFCHAHGA